MANKKQISQTSSQQPLSSSEEIISTQFETKEYVESLQYKVEDLETALKESDEQIAMLSKQLKETEENLKNKLEKWQQCARHYANVSFLAHKGYLITQGKCEQVADERSQQVLRELKFCENL